MGRERGSERGSDQRAEMSERLARTVRNKCERSYT
jgi:hypothetical protein